MIGRPSVKGLCTILLLLFGMLLLPASTLPSLSSASTSAYAQSSLSSIEDDLFCLFGGTRCPPPSCGFLGEVFASPGCEGEDGTPPEPVQTSDPTFCEGLISTKLMSAELISTEYFNACEETLCDTIADAFGYDVCEGELREGEPDVLCGETKTSVSGPYTIEKACVTVSGECPPLTHIKDDKDDLCWLATPSEPLTPEELGIPPSTPDYDSNEEARKSCKMFNTAVQTLYCPIGGFLGGIGPIVGFICGGVFWYQSEQCEERFPPIRQSEPNPFTPIP